MSTAALFDALGDPNRRRIVEFLSGGERTAGDLVAAVQAETEISQPGVSQHLRVLREAGLASVRSDGTRRFYALDHGALDAAVRWLRSLTDPLGSLAQPLDALETEIARGIRERRGSDDDSTSAPGDQRSA